MNLSDQNKKLFEFVKSRHMGQVRKYTGEPYWQHLLNVAELVSHLGDEYVSVALCHDLLEDTSCTENRLYLKMFYLGFSNPLQISECVVELTDHFTQLRYPYLNREQRKSCETSRMAIISDMAQTVKYADIIDNTKSIVENDPKFSKVYLNEKRNLLKVMTKGDKALYHQTNELVMSLFNELN